VNTQRLNVVGTHSRLRVGLVCGEAQYLAHLDAALVSKVFPEKSGEFEACSLEEEKERHQLVVVDLLVHPFLMRENVHDLREGHVIGRAAEAVLLGVFIPSRGEPLRSHAFDRPSAELFVS